MGGKTATSSSQVQIPPEILAQYNAVNARAEQAGAQPFQSYSSNPNAFVAPMTATQNAAQANINRAQDAYQPFYNNATRSLLGGQAAADPLQAASSGNMTSALGAGQMGTRAALAAGQAGTRAAVGAGQSYLDPATALAAGSARAVDPTALGGAQIGQFMSPYNEAVVQSTMANLRQQQGQEQSAETGNQIMHGAFGGDRGAVAKANLARQQDLASGQVLSGLYNQNYQQALGAAQQQQGVNLGAAQANRQALGAAGQQFAALGQQDYSQLSGAAQQLYGQGTGAAQQLYGQGMGAASGQAALGQQLYGQGASTSKSLQDLGNGAFTNGLQGAQAQMGAGQVEQQTQQAGLGALYNQFMQEKAYPFQTTQFLGQMAYGQPTGSTTTSTQPTGMFSGLLSDARMKENIEPIGETYDGQKIVKFRYKGHKNKEIGLIAQDVERHHPQAVREHGGIKYVDYDRATGTAAARGHFAGGGAAGGDETMAEIARINHAMFPYAAETGSRIGGAGGTYGSTPTHIARGKFLQAKVPQFDQGAGGLHELKEGVDQIKGLGDDVKDASKWVQGHGGHNLSTGALPASAVSEEALQAAAAALPPTDIGSNDNENVVGKYSGGIVRMRRAAGGSNSPVAYAKPYDTDDSYVPTVSGDDNKDQLKTADVKGTGNGSGSGAQKGGLGDLASAAKDVKGVADAVASIAAFFNRGGTVGRKAFRDGGSPYQDLTTYRPGAGGDPADISADEQDGEGSPLVKDAKGLGHAIMRGSDWVDENVARPAIKYVTGYEPPIRRVTEDYDNQGSLGAAVTPGNEQAASAAPPPPPVMPKPKPAVPQQPAAVTTQTSEDKPLTPPPQQQQAAAPPDIRSALGNAAQGQQMPPQVAQIAQAAQNPDWMQRSQHWMTPLLKGLGAMASSPSRYLGVAALQGLGAAAGSYQDVQNQQAHRELLGAETEGVYQNLLPPDLRGLMQVARDPRTGKILHNPKGTPIFHVLDTGSGDAKSHISYWDPDAKKFTYGLGPSENTDAEMKRIGITGDEGQDQMQRMVNNRVALASGNNKDQAQVSEKNWADLKSQLPALENLHRQLLTDSTALMKVPLDGVGAPGALHPWVEPLVGMINNTARALGVEPLPSMSNSENSDQIMSKINAWMAANQAHMSGQNNMHSMDVLRTNTPSAFMSPTAAREMMVNMMRANQMDRDMVEYGENFKKKYTTLYNFETGFKRDIAPRDDAEMNTIKTWMQPPDHAHPINPQNPSQSLFEYLMENRERLTPDDKLLLAKKFGASVLRWIDVN